jgi:hypothetical protein
MAEWRPHPGKQTEVLLITPQQAFEILYGGARGGGKTDAGQGWLLYDHEHPKFRGLVIRKNADDLRDWIDRARYFYAGLAEIVGAQPEVRFHKGGIIRTGHLADNKAYSKYQGHEYHRMLIEELTHISTLNLYKKLIASCRSTIPELRPQIMANCNPDGPGFEWVRQRWGLEGTPKDLVWTEDPDTGLMRVFVPARLQDNPTLVDNDPNYVKMLNGLPDGLREAWRDGSWDDPQIEGAYYTLVLAQARREGRIKLIPHDPSLKVHTVWDLGIGAQLVCVFVQKTSTEVRIIDSWQGEGSDGLPEAAIMLQNRKYLYGKHFAPHDASKTETGTGKTIRQQAAALGIDFQPVPNIGIADGITKGLMMFSRLYISEPKNEQLLSSLRNYRKKWDEQKLDWQNEPFHDWSSHFADAAVRYLALVEDQMTNEEPKPYNPPPQEAASLYGG